MVFVPKCTVFFPKLCKFCRPHINIFEKLYNQRKSCTALVHCSLVLNSFTMLFVPRCTVFPKLYKFCCPHINIFKKLYNQRKKLYSFTTLYFGLHLQWYLYQNVQFFAKAVQILSSPYQYFKKAVQPLKCCITKEKAVHLRYTVLWS